MSEKRLIDLETKLAHLEDTVLQLDKALCRQQEQIGKLESTEELLMARINELAASDVSTQSADEPPPHY
jgi:SlyX protein